MTSIAIVGAGFSGTLLAVNLLRQPGGGARVTLIERSARFGPGVAYGIRHSQALLNVPAGRMSALDDDPDHFLRWARGFDASVQGGSFVPRALYGRYLASLLDDVQREHPGRIERIAADARSVRTDGSIVELGTTTGTIRADRMVLAIGNALPADPPLPDPGFYASERYTRDPWSGLGLDRIDTGAPVLLIGTGLTMMDVVMELRHRGHHAPIHAISRRGLVSLPHRAAPRAYHRDRPGDLDLWPNTPHGMLRRLRRAVQEAAGKGVDWREVVTSLRADTPALWRRLGARGQAQFLRHLRPYWDIHRHRAAPQTWAGVEALIASGGLAIHAARLVALHATPRGVRATLRPRGESGTLELDIAHVVNCTGPETDPRRIDDPLLRDALSRGTVRADPLGLGLESTDDGRLVAGDGRAWPNLFLLGPMARPLRWETTAVPELRVHARRLADRLALPAAQIELRPEARSEAGHSGTGRHHA